MSQQHFPILNSHDINAQFAELMIESVQEHDEFLIMQRINESELREQRRFITEIRMQKAEEKRLALA